MSLIRDDDDPGVVAAAVIAFIVGMILCLTVFAETPRLTIRGRVAATEEEAADCVFHLDTVTIRRRSSTRATGWRDRTATGWS